MTDGAGRGDELFGVLDRMTVIFDAFDDGRGLGLSELASRAGLPKSTVSRIVSGLVRQRYLERDGKLIYLGLRLFELGQMAEVPRELRAAALPVMADLRTVTGETVHLAVPEGDRMVCIAIMRGRGSPADVSCIGASVPVRSSAWGAATLAPAAGVATRVDEPDPGFTWVAGAICPVGSGAIAALSLCGPSAGFDVDHAAARIDEAARAVERRLALRAHPTP
ncbi:IclR family transcriptional regulator [Mycetocola zhujimingii]|uniref:IclR family transcriptional regulator n=1 Tax=Mycetocola zhujimingii TaxID=2079792 RepID=UPI000D3DBD46|nr:helix-turn-helix domain-containing protein [Mycetocola zhujimingii]AWB86179.1 hypothetical protein C3E77_05850 [Mycetocola zhujimingii]